MDKLNAEYVENTCHKYTLSRVELQGRAKPGLPMDIDPYDRLYNLDRAPRNLPAWQTIVDDLGDPPPKRIAKFLGVGERTVWRWKAEGAAPRAACLALFWLTRWGRSEVNADAVNDARHYSSLAIHLERRVRQLTEQLHHVVAIASYDCANDPIAELDPPARPKPRGRAAHQRQELLTCAQPPSTLSSAGPATAARDTASSSSSGPSVASDPGEP